jgi:release factor glutamine methyltransferase
VDEVLAERGWLAVEIGFGQGDGVRRMFSQSGSTAVEVERDLAGIERVVVVRRG